MNNDLVTVIIPAYNSESFISKCIDSVLSQTHKNTEIIVVNDGSKDNTVSIVKGYGERIILLNKDNGGLCSTRNYGVKHATGKWVIFLDSDDYLDENYISNLLDYSNPKRIDQLVMCDFLMNGLKEHKGWDYKEFESKEDIFRGFLRGEICNRTVNKLYPLELIRNIQFPDGRDMLEDAFFTSHVLEKCNRLIRIPYAGYYYIRRDDSLSKGHMTPSKTSSFYSNTFEKDLIISKYIPVEDYSYFSSRAINHIKGCMFAVRDYNQFDCFKKLIMLVDILKQMNPDDKKVQTFCSYLSKCNSVSRLKRRFASYIMFKDTFKNKKQLLRSTVRKLLTFR